MNPLRMQLSMDTWAPIDASIALESPFDFLSKLGIFSTVLAGFAFAPSVVATHRNLKSTTHGGDWIFLLVRSHELELQSCVREKMLIASDRISTFRENSCMHRSLLVGRCTCQRFLLQKLPSHHASLPHSTLLKERLHRLLQCSLY
jgi:hypothetical protein